jgi:hypothetical protein
MNREMKLVKQTSLDFEVSELSVERVKRQRAINNFSYLNKSRRSQIAVILRKLEDPLFEDERPLEVKVKENLKRDLKQPLVVVEKQRLQLLKPTEQQRAWQARV